MNNKYILLITLIVCSCSPEQKESVSIPSYSEIKGDIINLNLQVGLLNERFIENIDDEFLVIVDNKNDSIFNVFELPELNYLYSEGRKGQGPGELANIFRNPLSTIPVSGIEIYNPGFFTLQKFKAANSGLQIVQEQTLRYSGQSMPLNGVRKINDSTYYAIYGVINSDTDYEYIALKPDASEPLYRFGQYPESRFTGPQRAQDLVKATAVKPDGSKIVTFYMYHPKLRIYNIEGDILIDSDIQDSTFVSDNKTKETIRTMAVLRNLVKASDKYIYVLAPNATRDQRVSQSYSPFIEIWNWNGELIKRLRVNDSIKYFTVSEKYKSLFAISHSQESALIKYDLSDILEF